MKLSERARQNGLKYTTVMRRIGLGWDKEEAVTTPIHKKKECLAKLEAIANGRNKFEGNPCKKCGSTLRYVNTYNCVMCSMERNEYHRAKRKAQNG